jgi:four helix bundle protein
MSKVFEPAILYKSVLFQKAIDFSVRIVKLFKYLIQKDRTLEALYIQLIKSGTSIGANISEAQSASSKKDFSNKLLISLKEARETDYWLNVFHKTEIITQQEFDSLIKDCDELEKLLTSSIKTSKGI